MGLYDKYENCYKYCVEIGLIQDGARCQGNERHPRKVDTQCLRCIYYDKDKMRGGQNE